jgi:outer membrane lipoprotein SlyB
MARLVGLLALSALLALGMAGCGAANEGQVVPTSTAKTTVKKAGFGPISSTARKKSDLVGKPKS